MIVTVCSPILIGCIVSALPGVGRATETVWRGGICGGGGVRRRGGRFVVMGELWCGCWVFEGLIEKKNGDERELKEER